MSARKKTATKRPSYTPEHKAGTVRLIVAEGRAVSGACSQTALREWLTPAGENPHAQTDPPQTGARRPTAAGRRGSAAQRRGPHEAGR